MTNQGWREHVDGLMALLLILKEGQRAFVEDNVKPFIDFEIRIAEERGRIKQLKDTKMFEAQLTSMAKATAGRSVTDIIGAERSRLIQEGRNEVIEELEKIKQWPEPKPGAGQELGPLAGTGMYMQYDADKETHEKQIEEIITKFNL